ncbi:MAG TPA: thermonuclease family protein [Rhizomicrobium sp.]|jgi:endonuclease YncB( thermonuclease family)
MLTRRFFCSATVFVVCTVLSFAMPPAAQAADTIYGTVVAVKSPTLLTLDYGRGRYDIRLVGMEAPRTPQLSKAAQSFVARLTLNRKARLRFYYREPSGVMVGRLQTDDRVVGLKDVGLELVRAGLVLPAKGFDYTYKDLSAAELDAQRARRGLWSTERP